MVDRLKRFAIAMFLAGDDGAEDTNTIDLKDYTVVLFYSDEDGDKVLIYSDEDLQNALEEYKDQKRVKVWAQVREKATKLKEAKSSSGSTTAATTQTDSKSAEDKGTQSEDINGNKDLADAVADLISCKYSPNSTEQHVVFHEDIRPFGTYACFLRNFYSFQQAWQLRCTRVLIPPPEFPRNPSNRPRRFRENP